jgi:acyl-CoA synthetase (NDP forming)
MRALREPASIAIVGASTDPAKPSGRSMRFLREFGYQGEVFPISSQGDSVQGLRAYRSLSDAPSAEVVIVARPAGEVVPIVSQCCDLGVKVVVVFAAGFAEHGDDGADRQAELTSLVAKSGGGTRVIGPNCLGHAHFSRGAVTSFASSLLATRPLAGRAALISQSGGFGAALFSAATFSGVGFSWFVTTGNESDVTVPDLMLGLVEEEDVDFVLVYLERIRDGETFVRAVARARELGKPVVVFSAGTSVAGARAALSHTGSLSDTSRTYADIFDQLGVQRVESIEEMMDVARALQSGRWARGSKTTIVTASGGAGVVMADACEANGLTLADWTDDWQDRVRTGLPPFASTANPIDTTASPGLPAIAHAVGTAAQHPGTDVVVAIMENKRLDERERAALIAHAQAGSDKPIVLAWTGGGPTLSETLDSVGVLGYPDPRRAAHGVRALAHAGKFYAADGERGAPGPGARYAVAQPGTRPVAQLPDGGWLYRSDGIPVLGTMAARDLLARYGVGVPATGLATSEAEAVAISEQFGYPVIMKIDSPEILHKARAGGVRANLAGPEPVRRAYAEMAAAFGADAAVLVQEQVSIDVELLVGMKLDRGFGPVMMTGSGGTQVELIRDTRSFLPPVVFDEAAGMIRDVLVISARPDLSSDARGAAAAALVRLSELVAAEGVAFAEIDINPLVITADPVAPRCLAVDWLFVGN